MTGWCCRTTSNEHRLAATRAGTSIGLGPRPRTMTPRLGGVSSMLKQPRQDSTLGGSTSSFWAAITAWVRECTPSFLRMAVTWALMVASETFSS